MGFEQMISPGRADVHVFLWLLLVVFVVLLVWTIVDIVIECIRIWRDEDESGCHSFDGDDAVDNASGGDS